MDPFFIDTHAHVYDEQFNSDLDLALQRASERGVKKIFLPNIDLASVEKLLELSNTFPETFYPMMGLHPCSVKADYQSILDKLRIQTNWKKMIAVGEIGIDLYWDKSTLEIQIAAFKQQIQWAKDYQLPIVIHARESFDEIFSVLDEVNDDTLSGVFHCFTGGAKEAEKILSYGGFKMGIGGVVTFKNTHLRDTLKNIDLSHLILETDSPYLAPAPYRGKRNEPSYIHEISLTLCDLYGINQNDLAQITTENALHLFQLDVNA